MPIGVGLRLTVDISNVGWWQSGSALDLDFANNRAFNRSTGFNGSPNGILTYTAPSPKMVYGDDGVLRYAPHNLVLNSGFSLGTDGALPTSWLERGVVTLRRRASENCAVLAASTGGTVGSSDDAREVISGLQVGKQFYVTFKAARDPSSVANVLTAVFAGTSINCNLTSGYQDFSFVATASGTSHSLFFGNAIGAAGNLVALIKDVQVAAYPVYSEYIPTTTAAVYSLPIDHNPTTFAPLGVLIEEQRTNLLLQSQTFNTTWATTQASISSNTTVSPDGTTTADTFLDQSSGTYAEVRQASISFTSGSPYTYSIFLKQGTRRYAYMALPDGQFPNNSLAIFDLQDGIVKSVGAGAPTARIQDCGNGWYRCSISATADASSTGVVYLYHTNDLGTDIFYTGSGSGSMYVWGAQLEAGAFPTSYIPTVASQVTRAADQVSILTSAFAFSTAAGTMAVDAGQSQSGGGIAALTGTNQSDILFASGPTALPAVQFFGTQSAGGFINLSNRTTATAKMAVGFDGSGAASSISGGAPATSAVAVDLLSRINALRVGSRNTDNSATPRANGHIKRLTYWNTRKSNAELQALSA